MSIRVATIALLATAGLVAGSAASSAGQAGKSTAACGTCQGTPAPGSVSTPPTFLISGRGWGHGVGMSQWGAYGYARHGWIYGRILSHYYPSTSLEQQPTTQIRVMLVQGRPKVVVSSKSPFRVRDGAGALHRLAAGDLRLDSELRVRPIDAKQAQPLPGPLTFLPGPTPLALGHPYRGWIQVGVSANGKKLQAVNVVSLESYLYGVVPEESPDTWPAEALKAQAVAARTYALATRKAGGTFDLYDDTRSQVYGGLDSERFSTTAAVDATAGQVVTYRGRPAVTYFFSTSGGRTAAIQDAWPGAKPVPYLVSVPDPYDSYSPHHRWGPIVFSAKPLGRKLHLPTRLLDVRTSVNGSGRVTAVVLVSPLGQLTLSGPDVRGLLDLRSTWFRVGSLSLSRPPGAVSYGSSIQLSGLARGVTGPTLQERVSGSVWDSAGKLVPGTDGSFATLVKPETTTTFRVTTAGASSESLRVPVAASVRLASAAEPGSLRGTVRPAFAGTAVEIQRASGADWSSVATAETDAQGAFRARFNLTQGIYRAVASPGRGLVTGTSPVLRVVAT